MTQWGLDVLFNPAKRHMDEEKQRLQSTREEVGDNSGGRRIDLESGKVTIAKQDDAAGNEQTPPEGAVKGKRRTRARAAKAESTSAASNKALTPAQERALKRRGREAR